MNDKRIIVMCYCLTLSECPRSTYKSRSGNYACAACPANSVTGASGSLYCHCVHGFHRLTSNSYDLPCKLRFIFALVFLLINRIYHI